MNGSGGWWQRRMRGFWAMEELRRWRGPLHKAVRELEGNEVPPERVRKAGGGRKSKAEQDPRLVKELERLVDPATRGDPMSPLRWSSKSMAKLAEELCRQGYRISAPVRLRTFCSTKTTACRRTGKRGRGPAIRIGMRSFNISVRRHRRFNKAGRRWFRSTPEERIGGRL